MQEDIDEMIDEFPLIPLPVKEATLQPLPPI